MRSNTEVREYILERLDNDPDTAKAFEKRTGKGSIAKLRESEQVSWAVIYAASEVLGIAANEILGESVTVTKDRAAEILNPIHREHYGDISEVNAACIVGAMAIQNELNNTAEWMPFKQNEDDVFFSYACSVCSSWAINGIRTPHCPNCGREMKNPK